MALDSFKARRTLATLATLARRACRLAAKGYFSGVSFTGKPGFGPLPPPIIQSY